MTMPAKDIYHNQVKKRFNQQYQFKLIIYDIDTQEIVKWIN